jgi:hypothetical protein
MGEGQNVERLMEERILDYGPVPLNQRRHYRRLLRAVLLLGLIAATIILGRSALKWAQFIYWQQQCLNFDYPPNQVIYQSEPINAPATVCIPAIRFAAFSGTPNSGTDIFVHRMRRPDGMDCLVELEFIWMSPPGDTDSMTVIGGVKSSVWSISPVASLATQATTPLPLAIPNQSLKIFAGQIDPNDASHFTFNYDLNGYDQTCDAWLNNSNQLIVSTRP